MKFVLVMLAFGFSNTPLPSTHQFDSQSACEAAKKYFEGIAKVYRVTMHMACIPDVKKND